MTKLLSKNILIYGGTNALKSLIPLLMLPILTTYLSLSDFGTLSLVETTIIFVTPFVLLNINGAINVQFFKVKHNILKEYITNALLLSLISSLIVLSIFLLFQKNLSLFLKIDETILIWIVIFATLRIITSVVLGLYQSRQEPFKFALYTTSQTIVDFTLSCMLVIIYQNGYIGRLEGMYISFFIFSIIGVYVLYRMDYLTKPTFKYTKDILNFGVPLIPHAIGGTIIAMSDRYFISYFAGDEEVGLYTIAYQLSAVMLLVSISTNQAWSPMLFKLLKDAKRKTIYEFTFALFILFTLVGVFTYIAKDLLFYILVNDKFYKAKEYFSWLLIGFVFQSFYLLVTNFLFYKKKTKMLAMITVFGGVLNLLLNYYLIHLFGVIGVTYATATTWLIYFILVCVAVLTVYKNKGAS